jgi:hypothetical protein
MFEVLFEVRATKKQQEEEGLAPQLYGPFTVSAEHESTAVALATLRLTEGPTPALSPADLQKAAGRLHIRVRKF